MECDIENCNDMLNFNKQIVSSLLDLKRHLTFALQKCERKLAGIERSLQKRTAGDTKVLICNAGMPYFKDRNYFFASNNEDEILKENHKELQLRSLPKVSSWTKKERDTFSQAIKEEVITDMLSSQRVEHTRVSDTLVRLKTKITGKKKAKKQYSLKDLVEMIGPLGEREFDWFKISSVHFEDIHSPLDCRVMWNVFLHPDINKTCWTKMEDKKLKEIASRYNFQNWDKIAKELATRRSAYQCFIRYNTKGLPKIRNCTWEYEEDERLLKLIEIFKIGDFIPWGEVASWMQNRTKQQAYFRWIYSLAPYLTKGRFTKSEDNILKDAVIKYGTNFRKISAALMPNRSTIQLHDHYQTLTTNLVENWNRWTLTEDVKLLDLFRRIGPNWSAIAKEFTCKSRTHLRHRHAALQKYIKRGVSLSDLHQNHCNNESGIEQEEKEEESCKGMFESSSNVTDINCNKDIDKELLEYFSIKYKTEYIIDKRKLYTMENLKHATANLYNILQVLNAKLSIPDDISDIKINKRDRQLFYSLREHIEMKNDRNRYFEVIDNYRSRMFGTNVAKEEGSHFVPPSPFDSQIKLKKSRKCQCIDYNLNTKNNFLLEEPIDFDIPDFVISYIGGNEQELQFQKLSHLLRVNNSRGKQPLNVQHFSILPEETLLQRHVNDRNDSIGRKTLKNTELISDIATTSFESANNEYHKKLCAQTSKKDNYSLISKAEDVHSWSASECMRVTRKHDTPVIDATHATLFSFKNLTYLRQLNGKYCSSNSSSDSLDKFFIQENKFQEAFHLLETRLEQMFKYPIGLSKTVLPEVYAMDTFSYDDDASDRTTPEMSELLEKHTTKRKLLSSSNRNGKKSFR
ncbi:snRNA-activating protein complex subunit 4 [Habropoda laboriosa]|uniref:snRNA-activating protein complex subunit 4 n=1 Tax=Habropoda laboriosa TaxID=597456 RepID=A0A0L7RDX2_9HYME|nr:snRNA-activating protein complex subunit 4 [Habropoda laboriosa]